MSLHVIFIDNQGQQLSDVTSSFISVTIPQNAFIMRIADDTKSYSNSTLTKLFEIDNTFYSKVLEYTTKGDYPFIDVSVYDFSGFTAIFNQLSSQFVGNNPPANIYDFSGYGGSGSGGSIDFSTIVSALNGITTALSSLTNLSNLSNLSDLANIITAISNKDNQSDIVDELRFIFTQNVGESSFRRLNDTTNLSMIKGSVSGQYINTTGKTHRLSLFYILRSFANLFSNSDFDYSSDNWVSGNNRLLARLNRSLTDVNTSGTLADISSSSVFTKLGAIESKLEQNLPFVTNVYPLVETNVDFPYEVKILNKDNCSDNKKNDI